MYPSQEVDLRSQILPISHNSFSKVLAGSIPVSVIGAAYWYFRGANSFQSGLWTSNMRSRALEPAEVSLTAALGLDGHTALWASLVKPRGTVLTTFMAICLLEVNSCLVDSDVTYQRLHKTAEGLRVWLWSQADLGLLALYYLLDHLLTLWNHFKSQFIYLCHGDASIHLIEFSCRLNKLTCRGIPWQSSG